MFRNSAFPSQVVDEAEADYRQSVLAGREPIMSGVEGRVVRLAGVAVGERCHFAALPSRFSRRCNSDGEGGPAKYDRPSAALAVGDP